MRETGDLIAAWRRLPPGSPAVLATVVATSGSTYRRPGARMLLSDEGWLAGSISGGCLEGDVMRTAWERTAEGPALITYDATADEDIVWGFGLGCNGVVQVLLERLSSDGGPLGFLAECYDNRLPGVLATVVGPGPSLGQRFEVRSGDASSDEISLYAQGLLGLRRIEAQVIGGETLLFEAVTGPLPVVIFGAGHDAVPLVEAAKAIGWHVTVVDWRASFATSARFPSADALQVLRPEQTDRLNLGAGAAVVVMTHNYLNDLEILRHVLPGAPAYVGLLGPRRRTDRLLADLGEVSAADLEKLHAPIGLDIGANEPDEIALAIVAEIQAFFSGRRGGTLNGHAEPLHPQRGPVLGKVAGEIPACDL